MNGESWIGEERAPDGTWKELVEKPSAKEAIRIVRRYRKDRGHLVDETRVRSVNRER